MDELALFAGSGGGILGSHLGGWRTIAGVEVDSFARSRLLQRQDDGSLPHFPIWDDVRTFDGRQFRGLVDLVSAGFPCQPFSQAGKKAAGADCRNLWPDTVRILGEVRPPFVLLENSPSLPRGGHRYFDTVIGDLATLGFSGFWSRVSAASVGAPHLRRRWWFVGIAEWWVREIPISNADSQRREAIFGNDGQDRDVAHSGGLTEGPRQAEEDKEGERWGRSANHPWWASEPDVGRVAHGVANGVDRLRSIGNGQVPAVVLSVLWAAGLTKEER